MLFEGGLWYCRRYYRVTTCHSTLSPLLDLSCALYKGHTLRHVACARVLSLTLSLATCLSRSPRVSLSTRVLASRLSAALGSSRSLAIYSRIDPFPPSLASQQLSLRVDSERLRLFATLPPSSLPSQTTAALSCRCALVSKPPSPAANGGLSCSPPACLLLAGELGRTDE